MMGGMHRYRNETSKLKHVESVPVVCVFFVRGGCLPPQTSARQRLHPGYTRSSIDDALFVCNCCLDVESQRLRL